MNSFNGDLYFTAGIDDSKFNVSAEAMERRVQEMSASVQSEAADMETSIQQFAQKGAEYITTFLVGKGMLDLTKSIIQVRGEFQQLEIAFETMLGSTEKANDLMAQLTRTAARTPFDLQGVAQGAKQLLAYGTAAEEVNDVLVHLGDIASGLSIPLNDLVMLYGTTMTQGRMFTQDLRQFMGRGIPIAEELAKQFGVTKDKVGELVTQGKVTSREFNAAIMAMSSEGGKFYNLMERQSTALTGQISNLEDAWDVARNNIGKNMEGIAGDAISMATSIVENLEPILHTVRAVAIAYGSYRAALILNILATKGETGVALIDNTVKKAKIQLLRLEEKATSGAAERIRELKKARQEEIATLESQLSAEERLNLIHQTRIANIGKVLTETQKLELCNLGLIDSTGNLVGSTEDYERIALSMMSSEQRMAVERGELTKNTGDYIAKLHEAVDAKHINIKAIDDEIAKTQDELKFAVEYRNVVQEQVATSRDRCKSLENEISMLDLAGDSEGAAAKATEWKAEKTKLATLEEELNTAATSVNEKQTNLETLAKKRNAAATVGNATADKAATALKNLLTVATKKATLAIKTLWAAMKANPLGWIVTAAGAVVAIFDRLKTKSQEAAEKQKQLEEEERRVIKASTDMRAQLDLEIINIKKATSHREEEKKMVGELNNKYGEVFGKYDTLAQWYDVLTKKSEAYVRALYLQAKIEKAVRDASDVDDELDKYRNNPPDISFWEHTGTVIKGWGSWLASIATDAWNASWDPGMFSRADEAFGETFWNPRYDKWNKDIADMEQRRDKLLAQASEWQAEMAKIAEEYQINLDPNKGGGKTVSDLTDKEKRELEKKLRLLKDAKDKETALRTAAIQAQIDAMDEGYEKRMAQLEFEHQQELAKIEKDAEELKEARRKAGMSEELTQEEQDNLQSRRNNVNAKYGNSRIQVVEEEINLMRDKYREYEKWVELVGQEAADKHFRGLREQGEDFSAWLNNRVSALEKKMISDAMNWTGNDQAVYDMFNDARAGANELDYYEKLKRAMEGSVSMTTNLTAKIVALKEAIDKIKNDPKLTDEQRATLGLQFAEDLVNAEAENQRRFNETYQMYSKTRRETIEQYQADIDRLVHAGDTFQVEQVRAEMKRAIGDLDENFLKSLFGEVFSGKATIKAIRSAIKDLNNMKGMDLVTFNKTYNTDFTQEELDALKEKIDAVNSSLKNMGTYNIADAFKDIRDGRLAGDLERVARGTKYIQTAFQNFTSVVSTLSSALNELAEASDNKNLQNTAKTVEGISNVLQTTGSFASAGASIGGGWGAVIGAVLGLSLGAYTEILKSNSEKLEAQRQAAQEGAEYQSESAELLLSILNTCKSLLDTVSSLDYNNFHDALFSLIQDVEGDITRFKTGDNGKTNWSSLKAIALNNSGPTRGRIEDFIAKMMNLGIMSGDYGQLIEDGLEAGRVGQGGFAGFINSLSSLILGNGWQDTSFNIDAYNNYMAEAFANYVNGRQDQFAQNQQHLLDEIYGLYNSGSFNAIDYFNAQQKVYANQKEYLEWYIQLLEALSLDTTEYKRQLAELNHEMRSSVLDMAEGLLGTDISSIAEEWLSIFEQFGDDVSGAFDAIDDSVDKMVQHLLEQVVFVQPLLLRLQNAINSVAASGIDEEGNPYYTQDDFLRMAENIARAKEDALGYYNQLRDALQTVGIDISSLTVDPSTFTGSIQNVSEETAGIIAGRMNAVVINQAEGVSVMRQQLLVQYEMRNSLAAIQSDVSTIKQRIGNTATPNPYLYRGIVNH